ncbi:flagellar brake protein [Metabacillus malikii]|uniref:C-di-GMP-binding flagellar brake protein YcgR n=1 Tax=Metabacillus malikii TaxID=1504265 RepID=A0ABT9ZM05_9BACI|nr:flagellar brake domain-containing protein [Metabacillus malikii]MDQ0232939.1 c-di-GMP-binding flagellar brake protein YcgR [Metabacillus malikii]
MLNIGDVIQLETKGNVVEKLKCKLVERKGNQLYIDYPINIDTGRSAFLMIGTELVASYITKDQIAYRFQTEVTGRVKDNIPMISLTYPGDEMLVKIQRREYVRIDTSLDVAIHPISNEFEPFTAVTSDISAGGAAILVQRKNKLTVNQEVMVWISLPFYNEQIQHVKVRAKIIRFLDVDNELFVKIPLQFLNIEENVRQTLIRFCFQKQIQMKRKGLIVE